MRIGLALSGGGALGAAHVGVLEELVRHGIGIDLVCGTSAGSIIGLLFCQGGLDAVNGFFDEYDKLRITSKVKGIMVRPPHKLFTDLRTILSNHVTAREIADIRPRFICVATDVVTGEPTVFEHGNPIDCVLASSAYPGVFPVQNVEGKWLVDGGISRNLPADVVRHGGVDFVIGSSLYAIGRINRLEWSSPLSKLQTMVRSIEIMETAMSTLQMTYCDFCFVPSTGEFKWYDFDRVHQIMESGRVHAAERVGELLRILESMGYGGNNNTT